MQCMHAQIHDDLQHIPKHMHILHIYLHTYTRTCTHCIELHCIAYIALHKLHHIAVHKIPHTAKTNTLNTCTSLQMYIYKCIQENAYIQEIHNHTYTTHVENACTLTQMSCTCTQNHTETPVEMQPAMLSRKPRHPSTSPKQFKAISPTFRR